MTENKQQFDPQALDKAIIELYIQRHEYDYPNLRFLLQDIGGLQKQQVDEILSRIKTEDLVKIYSDDTETK